MNHYIKYQKEEIYAKMIRILMEHGVAKDAITPGAHFSKDLALDSLDITALLMEVEMKFQITIPHEDAEDLINMKAVVQYIQSVAADKINDAL